LQITEEFLWKATDFEGSDTKEQMSKEIAKAGYYWFKRQLENKDDKPMKNRKFYVVEESTAKRLAYSRLIAAGGGELVSSAEEATIIIADKRFVDATPKIPGVPIEHPLILNRLILYENVS
jgi:hypothetical protein